MQATAAPAAPPAAPSRPVALVTGCSSGIGREAVAHLRRAGWLVVASARDPAAIADLAAPGEVEALRLDVTDDAQRRAAVAQVLARHGRIDALVNNAGYGAVLAVEDTTPEALREVFETNLFGLHALTLLVLPQMRRQGAGRIVNVASIAGHVPVPLLGAYCATKFALRALTQALRTEVRRFGVRVSLVEPGVIRTRFGARSLAERERILPDAQGSPYAGMYRRWLHVRMAGRGGHPRAIARRVVAACSAQRPRLHYFAPWNAKASNVLKRLLPDAFIDWGMGLYFRDRKA